MTGPLKYPGGQSYMANNIVKLMPPRCLNPNDPPFWDVGYLHYVEPYFGGGAVLFANDPEGISEVVNDIDAGLTNFWRVLRDEHLFPRFLRYIEAMPFSEDDYKRAAAICGMAAFNPSNDTGAIRLAAEFFVACRQSLAGRKDAFAPVSRARTRRGMNEQVSAWLSVVEGLPAVHERLKRVLILNRPAIEVIRSQDGPRTLFYLDPPFVHETRASVGEYGAHEMSIEQHAELLGVLATIQGKFLLSGYPCPLYDSAAALHGWKRHDFDLPNNAAGGGEKRRMQTCVWTNY